MRCRKPGSDACGSRLFLRFGSAFYHAFVAKHLAGLLVLLEKLDPLGERRKRHHLPLRVGKQMDCLADGWGNGFDTGETLCRNDGERKQKQRQTVSLFHARNYTNSAAQIQPCAQM